MKALLARGSAHCDGATTYFAAELWRDGHNCALAAPFSLRASGRFIAAALGTTGVSDADYDKALTSARAQEILKAWDDNYDVAVLQGVPAFGSVGAMTEAIKELPMK